MLEYMFLFFSGLNESKIFWDDVYFETFPNKNNVFGKYFMPSCFSQYDGVICCFIAQMTS